MTPPPYYHAVHPSPYADDCPTCAGMDAEPEPRPNRRRRLIVAVVLALALLLLWGGTRA